MEREKKIRNILLELGMPCNVKGYSYIKQAITLLLQDNDNHYMTKEIYPTIAKMNKTTSSKAERAIRYAIDAVFKNIRPDVKSKYFGNSVDPNKGKLCNSHFLAAIIEYIKETEFEETDGN